MHNLNRRILLPHVACLALMVFGGASRADESDIRATWLKRYPGSPPIDKVVATPSPEIFELRIGSNIYYSDPRADFVFEAAPDGKYGHIIDTRSKVDLTSKGIERDTVALLESARMEDGIEVTGPSKPRRLVVFEDPNCPYCKKRDQTLLKITDAEVVVFVIPILGQDSFSDARKIWCSSNRAATWHQFMAVEKRPELPLNCDTSALDRNLALAQKLHVNATPVMIMPNGSKVTGQIDLKVIQARLAL